MKNDNHLFKVVPFLCPLCGSEVELYETAKDLKSGKYKCTKCPRNTSWKEVETTSLIEVIKNIQGALKDEIQ